MVETVELKVDVTQAAGLGEPATVAVTIHLAPADCLGDPPIVCFAKPGGGYSRRYYTIDLPGPAHGARGAQAEWHAKRGWIFVAVDHLGVGDSSLHEGSRLTYAVVAAANHAAEAEILRQLAEGELVPGYPKLREPVAIGIGQSMGGSMTVVQQGRYHCYDGIGVLGYGVLHTRPPSRPGDPPISQSWIVRDRLPGEPPLVLNAAALSAAPLLTRPPGEAIGWGLHYDDIPTEVVAADLARFNLHFGNVDPSGLGSGSTNDDRRAVGISESAPWGSLTVPLGVLQNCVTPGSVASEAAAVTSPVLLAMGERDCVADPKGELRVYVSATSIDLFICPRMAHMHNFAGTRELFWRKIESWADWVRAQR
jgi:alpha-beta hydrolase superfamily lysophospholipase